MDHHETRQFGFADGIGGGRSVVDASVTAVVDGGLDEHDAQPR